MTRPLKVWGVGTPEGGRRVVATTTQKAAAEAYGIPVGWLRQFGGVTSNPVEIEAAMSKPGTVFSTKGNRWSRDATYRAEGDNAN